MALSVTEEISERYEVVFEHIGCDTNHIHILCSFHPKYSISEVVRKFKSITAKEIFKSYPEIKKDLWGGEFWGGEERSGVIVGGVIAGRGCVCFVALALERHGGFDCLLGFGVGFR